MGKPSLGNTNTEGVKDGQRTTSSRREEQERQERQEREEQQQREREEQECQYREQQRWREEQERQETEQQQETASCSIPVDLLSNTHQIPVHTPPTGPQAFSRKAPALSIRVSR